MAEPTYGPEHARQLRQTAQSVERRGDVIIRVSQSAWSGYFQNQAFLGALGRTGITYPSVAIMPDGC